MPSTFTPDLVHLSVQAGPDQSKPRHLSSQSAGQHHTHTLSLTRNATVCSSRASANPRPRCGIGFESHQSRYGVGGCDSICPAYKQPQRFLQNLNQPHCVDEAVSVIKQHMNTRVNPVKKISLTSPGPHLYIHV